MSSEYYHYICVLELANQCENKLETPLRIMYSPTGNHFIRRKHFLHYDESTDKYGVLGKIISVDYIKATRFYNAVFENGRIECPPTDIYYQDFLYEEVKK